MINAAIGGEFQAVTLAQPPRRRPRHAVRVVVQRPTRPARTRSTSAVQRPGDQPAARRGSHRLPTRRKRKTIYEDLNKRFAEQLWNIWGELHDLVDRQPTQRARRARAGPARRQRTVPGSRDRSPGLGHVGEQVVERNERSRRAPGRNLREGRFARHSATRRAARRRADRRDVLRRRPSRVPARRPGQDDRAVRDSRSSATGSPKSSGSTSRSASATSTWLGDFVHRRPRELLPRSAGDRPGQRRRLGRARRLAAADALRADPDARWSRSRSGSSRRIESSGIFDKATNSGAFAFISIPNFVLAFVLAYCVGRPARLVPGERLRRRSGRIRASTSCTCSCRRSRSRSGQIAVYMRLLRSDMIATLQEDFILMAKSKGISNTPHPVAPRAAAVEPHAADGRRPQRRHAHRRRGHHRAHLRAARHRASRSSTRSAPASTSRAEPGRDHRDRLRARELLRRHPLHRARSADPACAGTRVAPMEHRRPAVTTVIADAAADRAIGMHAEATPKKRQARPRRVALDRLARGRHRSRRSSRRSCRSPDPNEINADIVAQGSVRRLVPRRRRQRPATCSPACIWGARVSLIVGDRRDRCSAAHRRHARAARRLLPGQDRHRPHEQLRHPAGAPALVLALSLIAVLSPNSLDNPPTSFERLRALILALGIVSIPVLARITRANTLAWSQREFVMAARAQGAKDRRIIFREVLPNVLPAMFSIALLGVAVVIVAEGGLAILGVSVPPPTRRRGARSSPAARATSRTRRGSCSRRRSSSSSPCSSLNYLGDVVRARFDVRGSVL